MSAILVQLCDGIVEQVRSLTWDGTPFTVERTYAEADEELASDELAKPRVDVVMPDGYDSVDLETRGMVRYEVTVDLILRKRLGRESQESRDGDLDQTEIDSLVLLAETLGLAATYARMTDFTSAAWVKTEHAPLFNRAHLRQFHQFTSVIALTFEISQEL